MCLHSSTVDFTYLLFFIFSFSSSHSCWPYFKLLKAGTFSSELSFKDHVLNIVLFQLELDNLPLLLYKSICSWFIYKLTVLQCLYLKKKKKKIFWKFEYLFVIYLGDFKLRCKVILLSRIPHAGTKQKCQFCRSVLSKSYLVQRDLFLNKYAWHA